MWESDARSTSLAPGYGVCDGCHRVVWITNPDTIVGVQLHGACAKCVPTQECRDCGKQFPFDAEADRCPVCVAGMVEADDGFLDVVPADVMS